VSTAGNGVEALRCLERENFDLVLMDDRMPLMDGCETARTIRDPASGMLRHDVPIIAMTGQDKTDASTRCREAGMNGYLSKPFSPDQLITAVSRYDPAGSARPASVEPPSAEAGGSLGLAGREAWTTAGSLREQMRSGMLDRYSGDVKLVDEILELFREEMPVITGKIRDAIDAGDADLLELHAHSCKSAAGSIGFTSLEKLAFGVEHAAKTGDINEAEIRYRELLQELQRFLNDDVDKNG
jgi:CheY-like chemotaxis protein